MGVPATRAQRRQGERHPDRAHAREHSLEVELPFVQEARGEVPVVPLAVGDATDYEWVTPTAAWKTMPRPASGGAQVRVDPDFYVSVKALTAPGPE